MATSNLFRLMVDGKITAREATVPIAVVEKEIAADLGANTQVVVVSGETMNKQFHRHKELSVEDYAKVQAMVDIATPSPERIRINLQKNERAYDVFFAGKPYRLVFKVTAKSELFMKSFGRINSNRGDK